MPLTIAIARDHLSAARSGRVIAILWVVTAAGIGLSYPATGLLVDNAGLSGAFWFGAFPTSSRSDLPLNTEVAIRGQKNRGTASFGRESDGRHSAPTLEAIHGAGERATRHGSLTSGAYGTSSRAATTRTTIA